MGLADGLSCCFRDPFGGSVNALGKGSLLVHSKQVQVKSHDGQT